MKSLLAKNRQQGFTIMELMVTMVLMLVVLAGTFALMRGAITTANTSFEMTSAQQSLRNAQEFLSRELLTAGDGLQGINFIWVPTSFATHDLTSRNMSVLDPGASGYCSPGAIISDDDVPAGTSVNHGSVSTNVLQRTDRITMFGEDRSFASIDLTTSDVSDTSGYVRVPAARLADFQVNEVYFLTNGIAGTFFAITSIDTGTRRLYAANGDSLGLNRTGGTGNLAAIDNAGLPMILKRVRITQFYVDSGNKLVRRVIGTRGSALSDSVVAEHVLDLQIKYILRPAGSGTIVDQPIDQLAISDAASVRMIDASLRLETARPLHHDGQKYQLESSQRLGIRNVQFLEAPVPRDSSGNTNLPNPGPTPVVTPTPTPTPVPTPTPIPTPTPSPTPTPVPTPTPLPTPTPSPTPTPTPPPPTPTPTPTPGNGDG